jgi:HlyD family secretion protein
VRFTVDAFPKRSFQGQVQQIRLNPTTQQNVVTYNVRVSLSNPEHILLPGMTAYVSIGVASARTPLLVPNAALRFKPSETNGSGGKRRQAGQRCAAGGRPECDEWQRRRRRGEGQGQEARTASGTVYVIDQGELKPVSVQLGITDNRNTEVLGGELKAGDKVVIGENIAGNGGKPSSVGMRLF